MPTKATWVRSLVLLCGLAALACLVASCGCPLYSNRLLVGRRPPPVDVATLGARLRSEVNRPLSRFARRAGLLSTPFKRLGIFGWRDSGLWVVTAGEVLQAAWSTDGFLTADLRLESLTVAGEAVALPGTRYLRAEICERAIGLTKADRPCAGDRVRLAGRLMWDGDGWFEIHPQTRDGVAILSSTTAPVVAVALVLWQVWPTRPADAPPRLAREHFGEDFMELQAALVAAFPTPSDLQQLVDASLNVNIHAIAREGNLNERVIDVLYWAREQGRMQDLVDGARKRNPGSPKLRTIDDTLVARLAAE